MVGAPTTGARAVAHQYRIRAAPGDTFRALTDPAWLVRWLCDRAELEPRTGGRYLFAWTDGPTHTGRLEQWDPDRRVAFAWSRPGVDLAGTVLSFEIEPLLPATLLRIRHSGFPTEDRWTELYAGAEWGWTYFAMNLKSLLETGKDLRSPEDG